jgi:zinc protease
VKRATLILICLTLCSAATADLVIGWYPVPLSQCVLLPVPSDPTVSFRLWFKVGSQDDPPGKEGLAAITAAMLTEASTKQNRYEAILDKLFPLAGGYSASTSVEMTVISGRIHKDNLAEYYPLFMQAVFSPAFRQEDLDRLKSQTIDYLENGLRYSSDEELAKAVLYETIFAGTPYGHIPAGHVKSVKSITLNDVRSFYLCHFLPAGDNVVVGLGGGFDEATSDKLRGDVLTGFFFPDGYDSAPPPVPPPQPKPIHGLQVTIVEKDAPATAISIGAPIDVLRGQKDFYPLAVANSWFGEHRHPGSHLYQVIRELRGLNYGDYSYIEHFGNGGELQFPQPNDARRHQIFEIWLRSVPHEVRHFVLREALRELKSLVDNGMSEKDFSTTRNALGKYVLHYAPTTMDRLGYALDDKFYGIKGSHLDIYRQRMHDMTLAEVNAAIHKHLQYENLQIVIVTKDARALADALVADAPSPIKYPAPRPASVLKEDEEIARFPLHIKRENIRIVPVRKMFE